MGEEENGERILPTSNLGRGEEAREMALPSVQWERQSHTPISSISPCVWV